MPKKILLKKTSEQNLKLLSFFIIILMPIVLLKFNGYWIFTRGGIDPWVYTGYFLHLSEYLKMFHGVYYGTRLPWIVPGHYFYHFLGPLVGNYTLHLLIYFISIFSYYNIIKRFVLPLVGIYLMGTYPFFLYAMGWNYVDGAGITYLLLTLSLVVSFKFKKKSKLVIFLSGISFSAMIFTNLFLLIFTPFIMLILLFKEKINLAELLTTIAFFALGAIVLTLLLCFVNYYYTGHFLFFVSHFHELKTLLSSPNPWKYNSLTWISSSLWLSFPFSIFIISLISLIFYRKKVKTGKELSSILIVSYLIIFPVFIILNFTPYAPVLQLVHYASYLMPWMFLALAACINLMIDDAILSRCSKIIVCLFLPIATIFFFSATGIFTTKIVSYIIAPHKGLFLPTLLTLMAYLLLILSTKNQAKYSIFLFVSLMMSASFLVGPGQVINKNSFSDYRDKFILVMNTTKLIHSLNPTDDVYFWYENKHNQYLSLYEAISSTYLWGYRLIGTDFPKISPNTKLETKEKIVILSQGADVIPSAKAALERKGFLLKKIHREKIKQNNFDFYTYFIQIVPK